MGRYGDSFLAGVLTKKDFGQVLTRLREAAGLTVRDLARKADVPSGTVSGWCTGRHLPTLSQKAMFLRILTECGVAEADARAWMACWLRLRRPLGQRQADFPSPYRGLEPFQVEDAGWFFGRSRLTGTLLRRVSSGVSGPVMAVGASGSGKSSVLRAGVVATLSAAGGWQPVLLTPGERPVSALATQLAVLSDSAVDELEAGLRDQPARAVESIRRPGADRLLVVVDQFEEIFTARADGDERAAFLAVLDELSARPDGAVRVVAGMRADFYPDALGSPLLARALQDNQVTVGPMTEDELRQAITEPARAAGMELESGLAQVLLRDLAPDGVGEIGALPLLSHALLATWERGRRRTMTIADYLATGGIHGAIAQSAEAIFADLDDGERALVRRVFLRLVRVGDDTPDTRRRVQLEELTGGPEDEHHARTRRVLGRFVDRRLIVADADGVEISHEALLRAWPRLREWIDNDRSGHRLHRQLTEAARSWHEADRDPGALYRGVRLAATVDWAGTREDPDELSQVERAFVAASVEADHAERLRQRRQARRLRWLAAALAGLLVLSGAATVFSIQQRAVADRERNSAISRQVAGTANRLRDSDPALAAQLAVAAYRIAPTTEARSSLLTTSGYPTVTRMRRPSGARQAIAVNPAGTLLAAAGAASSDTAILLWDLREPGRPAVLGAPLTGHTASIYAVAFSPDGGILATGSGDKTIRLWDIADPSRPKPLGQPLTGPQDRVLAVEFSPDGSMLAAGSRDKTVRFWDVRDREHPVPAGTPLTGATDAVQSIAFTPTGNVMAIADAGRAVRVWEVTDKLHPRTLGPALELPSRVNTVAFSADGRTLAAGSNDATVRLWTMTDPAHPAPAGVLSSATGWINAITFSADGTLLAAANAGARVQVWDLARHEVRLDLPHPEPTTAVLFRDHDQALYTNSTDGVARRWLVPGPVLPTAHRTITATAVHPSRPLLADVGSEVQLWDLTNRDHPKALGPPLTAPPDSDRMAGTVAISPDGHTLATATRAGNPVLLWDITTPERPRLHPVRLTGHTALVESVTFSHDGRLLASTGDDGTVRLWSTTDPRNSAALATLSPEVGFVYIAAFSPNDQLLAAATQGGNLLLWDIRDPGHPKAIGAPIKVAPDDARSLVISPDGRTIAVGIADGTVRLWDIENPSGPMPLEPPITGPDGIIHALAFSPDGSVLAGGAGAGQTWLWNVSDRDHPDPLAILQLSDTETWSLGFNADGNALMAASGNVYLWDTDPDRVIQRICGTAGDRISEVEWAKHVPGAPYQSTCP